jgi:hypothetical protein
MTDDVFELNMFGELDYTELPETNSRKPLPPDDLPKTQYEHFVGGKMGYNDFLERWHQ